MQNLLEDLKQLLATDQRMVADGKLLKNKVIELGLLLDVPLIELLLTHAAIRAHFFQEAGGVLIFDKIKFQRFVSNKLFLADNYTAFANKIGLADGNTFIDEGREVVLSWPYRDCVLEGGQTKEDAGREEIFWNETIAPDDIDRLFAPKVLTNFKRYSNGGSETVTTIQPTDNLLIKGNNLLVLHSLKKRFTGRVKLIYLDPPYNTESDGFRYNDNFSQSTWLTFIKNRIEVAKELLSSDGFLFVHISFHQYAYLKVLLDEIFHSNDICTFNLLVRHPNRILKADKDFHDVMEYLLVYTKNKVTNKIAKRKETNDIDDYIYQVEELEAGETITINGSSVVCFKPGTFKIVKGEAAANKLQKISIRGSLKEGNSSGRFYEKYLAPIKDQYAPFTIFRVGGMGKDMFDYRYFYTPESGKSNGGYFQGVPVDSKEFKEKPYPNFLDFVKEFNNVGYEGDVEFRNGKKPEALLKQVFELGNVKPGDIVLDFFAGSGTTCAVAHKMGFQYIGVEQMDYGDNDSVKRLNAVIAGEDNGISKEVNWKGGGSFIYAELAKANMKFIEQIHQISEESEFNALWEAIQKDGFLSYKVDPKEINRNHAELAQLSLEDKKRFLIEVLDKNQLYINYSEIADQSFKVPTQEKKLNQLFYQSAHV
ncbi:site-specific DNA-methyltransferase [Mucilaginibacter pocheonensis]|uniref:site-specific DNA-methyltransferase (adenine-specific) n=1 Tax=Mucilaginibacter pocheonensis TaxID=398050 RepID=A0ABU1T7L6_9SPHI|nr:site-specific DNA-methyltransferase [Mucilaginibacter pocheonensis]MDR6941387.1 adenine-specific DNA-methyltransferase [Mucilaginibacter pocheonensis]